jgi:hypothetical protein
MASLDSLRTKAYGETGVIVQTGTNGSVAMRLRYISTGTVTSVTVGALSIITVTVETAGITTKTYTYAAYTTMGAMIDKINSDNLFQGRVLDCLRSLTCSAANLVQVAVTAGTDANGVIVWNIMIDTTGPDQLGVCLTNHRDFDFIPGAIMKLQEVVYGINFTGVAANKFQIWQRKPVSNIETQVFGALTVDTTVTTLTFTDIADGFISAEPDVEFIVLGIDTGNLVDAAGNFLRAVGLVD